MSHDVCFGSIIAVYLLCGAESQQASLNRTTPSGMQSVCPNAPAVFTCRVINSSTLVWKSKEYIGENPDERVFTTDSAQGSIMRVIDGNAILTLNSDTIMESELRIRASVNSSIRCLPDDADRGVTVNLVVYSGMYNYYTKYDIVYTVDTRSVCILSIGSAHMCTWNVVH